MHVWTIFLGVVLAILFLVLVFWLIQKVTGHNIRLPSSDGALGAGMGMGMRPGEIDAFYSQVEMGRNQSAASSEVGGRNQSAASAEISAFYDNLKSRSSSC